MAEEKTRVDFNAPSSLVQRADIIADILDTSRTSILIDALRDELDTIARDDSFQRRLREAYYQGNIEFETVESVLGTEEAMRMRLLKESLGREPPEPRVAPGERPTGESFYGGDIPEWRPDEGEPNEEGTESPQ